MSYSPVYYKKPKRKSNGGLWFLTILLIIGLVGGGYYLHQTQEAQRLERIQKQKDAEEQARLEQERQEAEARKLAEDARLKKEEEAKKLKEQQEAEARRKADEQAKLQGELEKQKAEEARRKAEEEERLRRQKERDKEDDTPPVDEPVVEDKSPKPFDFDLPDLRPFTPESKDVIPMDKDKVIGSWSWSSAPKYDELTDFPTETAKWTSQAQAVKMEALYNKWREQDVSKIKASPSAKDYPGVPEEGAPLVERDVVIDASIGGWHSTGLYAPPGAEIKFTFSGVPKNGVSVRIGCHTDSLIHKDVTAWTRLPIMGNSTPVTKSKTSLADPCGGLVYICVNEQAKHSKVFRAKISGATPAPLYIMGETTLENWKKQLETAKVGWGEIRTPRIIYTLSLAQLKRCEKIVETCEVLQKGMALQDWIVGWDVFPDRIKRPMRLVVDRQISVGAGHSGYPAMGYMDWGEAIASGSLLTNGDWGLWHEVGHNHQGDPFAMKGQTEVSVNIFSMVCQTWAVGVDPRYGRGISSADIRGDIEKYLADKSLKYDDEDTPNGVQLFLWGELMYHFGPEPFREVNLMYHKKPFKEGVTNDEKWTWVMEAFGKVLKKDLTLYCDTWKIPVGNKAKAQFKRFKPWKPGEKYPAPTYLEPEPLP